MEFAVLCFNHIYSFSSSFLLSVLFPLSSVSYFVWSVALNMLCQLMKTKTQKTKSFRHQPEGFLGLQPGSTQIQPFGWLT